MEDPVEELDLAIFLQYDPHAYQLMEGQTALHLVALAGRVDLMQYLLTTRKMDVNVCNHAGRTALAETVVAGTSVEMLNVLWQHGANPLVNNTLHHICKVGCDPETFTLVLQHVKGSLSVLDDVHGWSPLHMACRFGHLNLVQILVEHSAQVTSRSLQHNMTPLELACVHDQVDVVQWLLEHKEQQSHHDNHAVNNLLCIACQFNALQIVKLLVVVYKADPYHTDARGETSPFACAVKAECLECIYYLMRYHNAQAHLL